jgi:hypothetical protein
MIGEEFFNELPVYSFKFTPVTVPAATVTKLCAANPRRFYCQFALNSGGPVTFFPTPQVSATFGYPLTAGQFPALFYNQVGGMTTLDWYAFQATGTSQWSVVEGILNF